MPLPEQGEGWPQVKLARIIGVRGKRFRPEVVGDGYPDDPNWESETYVPASSLAQLRAERDRAIEQRENANTSSLRIERERDEAIEGCQRIEQERESAREGEDELKAKLTEAREALRQIAVACEGCADGKCAGLLRASLTTWDTEGTET